MAINKKAVDSAARKYWSLLFEDYGEQLTRDIPRRIKAALVDGKRVASVDDNATVLPIAHANVDDGMLLEGLYKDATTKLMFLASLDKAGNVTDIKTHEIR